uniref:Uncharacterized protein n=1 Tax=Manihot esculenta TaxID=3983 RepID=A0A2C9W014_MANES
MGISNTVKLAITNLDGINNWCLISSFQYAMHPNRYGHFEFILLNLSAQ